MNLDKHFIDCFGITEKETGQLIDKIRAAFKELMKTKTPKFLWEITFQIENIVEFPTEKSKKLIYYTVGILVGQDDMKISEEKAMYEFFKKNKPKYEA